MVQLGEADTLGGVDERTEGGREGCVARVKICKARQEGMKQNNTREGTEKADSERIHKRRGNEERQEWKRE